MVGVKVIDGKEVVRWIEDGLVRMRCCLVFFVGVKRII